MLRAVRSAEQGERPAARRMASGCGRQPCAGQRQMVLLYPMQGGMGQEVQAVRCDECKDDCKKAMKPIAWKCPQCGEIYFGDECVSALCKIVDIAKKLEEAIDEIH